MPGPAGPGRTGPARSRPGRARDRRERGRRGPRTLPGPLTPLGTPPPPSPAELFDRRVAAVVDRLRRHLAPALDAVQFGVEEMPVLPGDWAYEVPLCTHVRASGRQPARLVVYRLPVLGRARGRADIDGLLLDLVVEEVADLLGRDPDDLDPRLP